MVEAGTGHSGYLGEFASVPMTSEDTVFSLCEKHKYSKIGIEVSGHRSFMQHLRKS
jgi:hypothetical protein